MCTSQALWLLQHTDFLFLVAARPLGNNFGIIPLAEGETTMICNFSSDVDGFVFMLFPFYLLSLLLSYRVIFYEFLFLFQYLVSDYVRAEGEKERNY